MFEEEAAVTKRLLLLQQPTDAESVNGIMKPSEWIQPWCTLLVLLVI